MKPAPPDSTGLLQLCRTPPDSTGSNRPYSTGLLLTVGGRDPGKDVERVVLGKIQQTLIGENDNRKQKRGH